MSDAFEKLEKALVNFVQEEMKRELKAQIQLTPLIERFARATGKYAIAQGKSPNYHLHNKKTGKALCNRKGLIVVTQKPKGRWLCEFCEGRSKKEKLAPPHTPPS